MQRTITCELIMTISIPRSVSVIRKYYGVRRYKCRYQRLGFLSVGAVSFIISSVRLANNSPAIGAFPNKSVGHDESATWYCGFRANQLYVTVFFSPSVGPSSSRWAAAPAATTAVASSSPSLSSDSWPAESPSSLSSRSSAEACLGSEIHLVDNFEVYIINTSILFIE